MYVYPLVRGQKLDLKVKYNFLGIILEWRYSFFLGSGFPFFRCCSEASNFRVEIQIKI